MTVSADIRAKDTTTRSDIDGATLRVPAHHLWISPDDLRNGSLDATLLGTSAPPSVQNRRSAVFGIPDGKSYGSRYRIVLETDGRAGNAWALDRLIAKVGAERSPAVAVPLSADKWTSRANPGAGWLGRWTRGVTVARGYPEAEPGFKLVRQIASAVNDKPGASFIYSNATGQRYVIYQFNTALYYDEDDATPVSIKTGLSAVYQPSWACMGSPAAFGLFVNGTDAPVGVRDTGSSTVEAFLANFEAPNTSWTATPSTTGGSLADGVYQIRIAQVEVDSVTGTIVSGPAAVKTATVSGGGGNGSIAVAQASWTPNSRATHWRVGITAVDGTDSPANYFWSGANTAIGTTTITVQSVPTTTTPFAYRNGFYAVTDLTEIISGKHPRGVIIYEGRFVVWYADDNRILWTERDEWAWYATNSLDTGAEGGWNLPVRCCVPMTGYILVFTEASVHAVYGDFARDVDGGYPTYAANAIPKTLETGIGILGGPAAAKVIGGVVYFISARGPAAWLGKTVLLGEEDFRLEWKSLDKTGGYPARWQIEEDPDTGSVLFLMTRRTNSSRPMDGASTAGIPDLVGRWLPTRNVWDAPLQLDLVHLSARTNGAKASSTQAPTALFGTTPDGTVIQFGFGHAGGIADGIVTSTDYDGILASANNTTSATIALAGISADALIGYTITLRYPTGDSAYPFVQVQKRVADNTATVGGNVTLTWVGAVTAPSTSFWTVRLGGRMSRIEADLDPFALGLPGAMADSYYMLERVEARFRDKIGAEAAA